MALGRRDEALEYLVHISQAVAVQHTPYKQYELDEDADEFVRERRRARCPGCPALFMCQSGIWPDGAVFGCEHCHSIMVPTTERRLAPLGGRWGSGEQPLDYRATVLVRCTSSTLRPERWVHQRHPDCNCYNRTRPLEGYDGIMIKENP